MAVNNEVTKLGVHEKECALRFKAIEDRLARGSERMDRMEMSVWGVYPFILASVFLAKYFLQLKYYVIRRRSRSTLKRNRLGRLSLICSTSSSLFILDRQPRTPQPVQRR